MGSRIHRRTGALVVAALVAGIAASVVAEESTDRDRVIHRYLESPDSTDDRQHGESGDEQSHEQPAPAPRSDIRPQRTDDAEHGPPGLWVSPGDDEWILTEQGPVGPDDIDQPHGSLGDHAGPTPLDGATDLVDQLNYQASFDPSVVPFKRGGVQNQIQRVNGVYVARLAAGHFHPIDTSGQLREGEEQFWGSFLVRMVPGQYHRIPSVSPHQRVLSVQTEPRLELEVAADDADNFYVSADHEGLVRINMQLGVDRQYFDGPLDRSIGWEHFEPPEQVDGELAARVQTVHEMIGVDRESMSPVDALEQLVEYHREFESRPLDPDADAEGDRYVRINEERVGVCRHRSLVFMISAKALGFDVRYVYNEAHAFVEVHWPRQGWRRIDLGGSADDIQTDNRQSGRVHDGIDDDQFPRPDSYEEELGAVDDTTDEVADGDDPDGVDTLDDSDDGGEDLGDDGEPGPDSQFAEIEPDDAEPEPAAGSSVEILEADGEMYRGEDVEIRGRVQPAAPGASVQVVLVPAGTEQFHQGIPVGTTTVGDDGTFRGEWQLPQQISLGRWRLEGQVVEAP